MERLWDLCSRIAMNKCNSLCVCVCVRVCVVMKYSRLIKRRRVGKLQINLSESKDDWLGEAKTQSRRRGGTLKSLLGFVPDLHSRAVLEFSIHLQDR